MSWDPYDRRPEESPCGWPLWLWAVGFLVGLGLFFLVWYLISPDSIARIYGRTLGPPLRVSFLEMAVGSETVRIPAGGTLDVNPHQRLSIIRLGTNRWRNYDLLYFSPDFDINAVIRDRSSLLDLLGREAFLVPKTVTVEAREGDRLVASFALKAAFSAQDWGRMAQESVEIEPKIVYYRKALEQAPQSAAWRAGLRQALEKAGRLEELIVLLEGDLLRLQDSKSSDNKNQFDQNQAYNAQTEILGKLLGFYRERQDGVKEIQTMERLLTLAEKTGQKARAQSLKAALANARKSQEPLKAVDLYEDLYLAAEGEKRRPYLVELLALYRNLGLAKKEESVYERLLPLASKEELAGLWGEILRLREKRADLPGQMAAWEALAGLLPPGESKANAYKRLGFLKYETKDLVASEKAYLLAIEHGEDDGAVYLNLARLALAKKDRAAYRGYLAQALKHLREPQIRLELAQALTDDGLKIDAAPHWEALATLKGTEKELNRIRLLAQNQLINLRRPPEGQMSPEFERLLYNYSKESVEFYNLGVAHFQGKNWEAAIKAFLKALELDHNKHLEADARGYLLALYKETGQTKEMLAQANWIYPADPKRQEIRDLIADQMERDQDWAGLAKLALDWTGSDDDAANWRILSLAQRKLGRDKEAALSLLKVAQRDFKATSWLQAAQALTKTGAKSQAKAAYERVLDLEPDNQEAEEALVKMALESLGSVKSGS
ncbi:MAG: tetratricopeptide repeat protein [Deltaproteobacteria bacterium]|jgi:tetratricopeptide (TPR) repeat protein|nr:tetratricopeptide repeat protein [Deltaproteobacteria bacterium]